MTSQFVHLPDGGMLDVRAGWRGPSRRAARCWWSATTRRPRTGLRHGHGSFMVAAEDLAPALDGEQWEVEVCESRPCTQAHPETGEPIEIQDSVIRAVRAS